jgi:tRNA (guanine-N7-)-methyltransferase
MNGRGDAHDRPAPHGDPAGRGSFFGRRKGPKLRAGQARALEHTLPRLRLPATLPADLGTLFKHPVREVRLEIGFGGAEHLLAAARAEPEVGFIGCEPFVNGMVKALTVIDAEGIDNIRLWDEDAGLLLPRLPEGSLARVDLFYPDPWPKRRQRKRRFISVATLGQIARVLRPGGQFRFASDIDDYVGWTLARLAAVPHLVWRPADADDWRMPFEGWVRTRYEAKALKAGRRASYLRVTRA